MKECFYKILGVAEDASGDEIKKAYRLLALKWHPDKNSDRQEEATQVFRGIQEAYEVLSDERERAFYDRNKSSILRGISI